MPTERPPLGLMLSVTGRKQKQARENDWQVPNAIVAMDGKVEMVFLIIPAWQELARASQCAVIMAIKGVCDTLGIELVLIRKLWPHPNAFTVSESSPMMDGYYAAAMSFVARDAKELRIDRTGFDVEPLKTSAVYWLRDNDGLMDAAPHRQIHMAIRSALDFAPPPTFVMPSTNINPKFWGYAFADLGEHRICWRTYYAKSPDDVNINPPPDEPFTLRYPSWMVTLPGDTKFPRALIPSEFATVLEEWAIWLGWFQEMQTAIIYPPKRGEHTVQVCRALAEVL